MNEYKYLGIIFNAPGTFSEGINYLCKKALKALFCIRKALASEKTNTSLFLKLYEQCVKPILLYCSEVWALERLTTQSQDLEQKYESLGAEKVQLKFANTFLGRINQQQIMQLGQNLVSSQLQFIV